MDCFSCVHFHVTWDKDYPRGCDLYQFKTVALPSSEVKRAIGRNCPGYEKKEQHKAR